MSRLTNFMIKDVRCFGGEQNFNIRPITFLIGENSTGKTTMLGCLQAVLDCYGTQLSSNIDFNKDPYQMGAFRDIARKSNPLNRYFELGFKIETSVDGVLKDINILFSFCEQKNASEPKVQKIRFSCDGVNLVVSPDINSIEGIDKYKDVRDTTSNKDSSELLNALTLLIDESGDNFVLSVKKNFKGAIDNDFLFTFGSGIVDLYFRNTKKTNKKIAMRNRIMELFEMRYKDIDCQSIAPIRSKPQRTYDPIGEQEASDGSEIPVYLMNLSLSNPNTWEFLHKKLIKFGKSSGLFKDIAVKNFGKNKNDPFQIQLSVRGPKSNIMDVGYGVSQILPILVRILSDSRTDLFLLQQPEVHLHPKAQAEFVSLLIEVTKDKKKNFILETHSDYMIDRARIEIMQGNIPPEDVSIIYLEPKNGDVKVHNITFDEMANMSGVPKGYRDFFIDEADRLLGLEE